MIELKNLCLAYGSHVVLDELTATWSVPGIHGIAGLNGAGKTTLFNAVAGYKNPVSGTLQFCKRDLVKDDVFFLETSPYFYPNITGYEYLSLFSQTANHFDGKLLNEVFQLPLHDLIDHYSTGMKKKLAIMAMLKKDKPIYLLDEPFNGLDLESNHVLEILLTLLKERGKTILISSHILDPLLRICDDIHLLKGGRLEQNFSKNNFENVEQALFGKLALKAKAVIERAL
ncbi:MAG TPA: ABC transporter ATP-binding protein [Saprospiraceae bacterium]|nr:ABC transporter ATP-binding protein [Saprospiraceae bacterium]HRG65063.1 ABC transporter ATP-binding protein [Saprospiraceae bacterium]